MPCVRTITMIPSASSLYGIETDFSMEVYHIMKGLTDYEKYKVIRPLPDTFQKDSRGFPVLKVEDYSDIDWEKVKFTSFSNLAKVNKGEKTVLLMFHYDMMLNRLWNDPLKYIKQFSQYCLVATPDFSAYTNMDPIEIEHNIYKNRWLGCTYQSMGIRIIPTITWADERTYDACFGGVPYGCPVVISTIGCTNFKSEFLKGFNEMKRRIDPSLVIVRGNLIKGMFGKFIVINFEDTFNLREEYEQLKLFPLYRVVEVAKEVF